MCVCACGKRETQEARHRCQTHTLVLHRHESRVEVHPTRGTVHRRDRRVGIPEECTRLGPCVLLSFPREKTSNTSSSVSASSDSFRFFLGNVANGLQRGLCTAAAGACVCHVCARVRLPSHRHISLLSGSLPPVDHTVFVFRGSEAELDELAPACAHMKP
jgi:hypothetical protein